jgi:hypothetical protein
MKPAQLLLCYGASIDECLTHQAAFRRAQSPTLPVKRNCRNGHAPGTRTLHHRVATGSVRSLRRA